MTLETDVIIGSAATIGCVVFFFAKIGLIRFGKNNKCNVPECHDKVIATAGKTENIEKEITDIKETQGKIFKRLDDMPRDIVHLLKETKGLL